MPVEAFDLVGKRVWVTGHNGMVGSAIVRRLTREGCEILTAGRRDVDLLRQADVEAWMDSARPEVIFAAAAKVGGIQANDVAPADFIYENLAIETNLIHGAWRAGVSKLIFMGSSCVYPKFAEQPISESALLSGPLEPTNQWYAIAKIAGIKLCQAFRRQYGCDFIAVQPTNLYGPGDNYDLQTSHVLPALVRKVREAQLAGAASVTVWGSGEPLREFLHVDDLADAVVHLAKVYSDEEPVNIGTGEELTIRQLAMLICEVAGFGGELVFDGTMPDGTPRKCVDSSKLRRLGWRPTVTLQNGLAALLAEVAERGFEWSPR